MIKFIYGGSGSGKTEYIEDDITARLKSDGSVILLVPEQQAIIAERSVNRKTTKERIPTINLEVLNFNRLSNRVFREYGGIQYENVTNGGRALIMWKALFSSLPFLKQYSSGIDTPSVFIPSLLEEIEDMQRYNITPSRLEEVAASLPEESKRLSEKLSDFSVLFSSYLQIQNELFGLYSSTMSRLSKTLSENSFFSGKDVYIDSFAGFSPEEYDIIRHIIRQADNLTISLCFDPRENQLVSDNTIGTAKKLKRLSAGKQIEEVFLDGHPRFASPELAFLEENMFKADRTETYEDVPENIHLIEARNIYSEAETAAREILELVKAGSKYRDIAVIMRSESDYEGVIDAIFDRYGIPYHFSRRVELDQKPVFKLILSALNIKNGGFKIEDVIVFIKTGFSGISKDEADLLCDYAYRWNIRGNAWTSDEDWIMNPDGYTARFTERSEKILKEVNEARRKVVNPLIRLFDYLDGKRTVKEVCCALYDFLTTLGVPSLMEESGSEEDLRLWNALCDVLDQMVLILPSLPVNALQFSQLISLVIRATDIGTLPSRVDEVTIGSSGRLKISDINHAILLGVNEGIFPAAAREKGMLSDREKTELETYDLIFTPKVDYLSVEELYSFYKSATAPKQTLTIIYSSSDISGSTLRISPVCERLKSAFPKLQTVIASEASILSKLETKETSFEYAVLFKDSEIGRALQRIYTSDEKYSGLLKAAEAPLELSYYTLAEDTVNELFKSDLKMTQSRLEQFVKCAFSYQCKYNMKLTDHDKISFTSADTGTFIHHVLEKFMSCCQRDGKIRYDMTNSEIEELVDSIISDYIGNLFKDAGQKKHRTNRMIELFARLKRSVIAIINCLIEELAQSEFIPCAFEMKIDDSSDQNVVSPFKVQLSDNTNLLIYGTIDRVDAFRKQDKLYFRVVDYKTGSKVFSADDIELGLNLQMLLYMFSVWKDKSETLKKITGCENCELVPSGVLYYEMKADAGNVPYGTDSATVLRTVAERLKRTGMLLSTETVLRACERALEGRYIPVREAKGAKDAETAGKANAVSKPTFVSSVKSLELVSDFGRLLCTVEKTVRRLGDEIKGGKASAVPLKDKEHDGCRYCKFKPICRRFDF